MVIHKKVALRFSLNSSFTRQIVRGIINYTRKHGPWDIYTRSHEPISLSSWADLKNWEGDGIITPAYRRDHINILKKKGIPVVTTSRASEQNQFPSVVFDDQAIGEMAARHLLEHDLDRFAFIGPKEWDYSRLRCDAFVNELKTHDALCTKCWIRPAANTRQLDDEWIKSSHYLDAVNQLTPPIGVFASSDRVGYGILAACRQLNLRVPEDICLISVDNDEILCTLAHPNLTSIELSGEDLGYQAAKMLATMMDGTPPEENHIMIPPIGVMQRNSSDSLKVSDPDVADALRYIRNHSGRFIDVSDIMSIMPISRRSLERKFQEVVGHGIYKEINRCHVERAKQLLENTDWMVSKIAQESGFNSTNRFEDIFRKETRLSATAYRKKLTAKSRRQKG